MSFPSYYSGEEKYVKFSLKARSELHIQTSHYLIIIREKRVLTRTHVM